MPYDRPDDPQHLLIDGRRVPAAAGGYFTTVDPATEQPIARVAEADAADVDAAVRAARAAFEGEWGQGRAAERGHALLRLAALIRQNLDALVALGSLDSGNPVAAIRRQDLPAVLAPLPLHPAWPARFNARGNPPPPTTPTL